MRDLRRRGLKDVRVFTGDGGLGLWAAVGEVYPEARQQLCWCHKMLNVLDKLPQRLQPEARTLMRDVYTAPTREEADARIKKFALRFERDYPRAVASLTDHQAELLTYYDFPREHWKSLRTSNPIESVFDPVRLRTRATRRMRRAQTGLHLVFQLIRRAEQRWRRIDAPHLVAKVLEGVQFVDGVEVLPMSRGPSATMVELRCRKERGGMMSPVGRRRALVMPAPVAVKGSACGPLRALDRCGRGHRVADTTAGPTRARRTTFGRVGQLQCAWEEESATDDRHRGRRMAGTGLQERGFIVGSCGTTDGDNDAQPHIAQHPDRFRMFLAALARMVVVGARPRTAAYTTEGKYPERLAQGMNASATKVDRATRGTLPGHRSGARFALGDAGILIPVAIVAQFSDHPGGECVTSAGQAQVELAVRVEFQDPLNLPIVRLELGRQRLELHRPAWRPGGPSRARWAARSETPWLCSPW